jgi:hypothetical protein
MRRLRIDVDLGRVERNLDGDAQLVDEVLAAIVGQRGKLNSAATSSHVLDRGGRTVGWWSIEEVDAGGSLMPSVVVTVTSVPPTMSDVGAAFTAGVAAGIDERIRRGGR